MILLIYIIAGWYCLNRTFDANKIFIYQGLGLFFRKLVLSFAFGWVFIPWYLLARKKA